MLHNLALIFRDELSEDEENDPRDEYEEVPVYSHHIDIQEKGLQQDKLSLNAYFDNLTKTLIMLYTSVILIHIYITVHIIINHVQKIN